MLYDDDPRRPKHWPIWSEDRKTPLADHDEQGSTDEDSDRDPNDESLREGR